MTSKNEIEIEVYDLLVDRDFDELDAHERELVLGVMTADEYTLRREILALSPTVFSEEEEIEPAALILPSKRVSFLQRSIPLYQLFITAAALILTFLLLVPFLNSKPSENTQTEYITQVDTVFIEKREYDTIVKVEEKPVYLETIKYISVANGELKEAPRLLEVNTNQVPSDLNVNTLKNKGVNMTSDPTSVLIRDYQLVNEN